MDFYYFKILAKEEPAVNIKCSESMQILVQEKLKDNNK